MKFNRLVPELTVSDFDRSLDFYTRILGFRAEYQRASPRFAFMSLQGSQLMIQEKGRKWKTGKLEHPFGRGINFQIEVKDITPLLESVKGHNCPLFSKPRDNWYRKADTLLGCREFLIQDPDGYLLRFSQDLGTRSAE